MNKTSTVGSGVSMSYNDSTGDINFHILPIPGRLENTTSISDNDGHFVGYFNSLSLYDSIGRIAQNGDSMAVGFFLNYLMEILPEHEGLGNSGNCAFIPINDSLYYLIYKSAEVWIGAPDFAINFTEKGIRLTSYSDGLYYSKVRVRKNRLFVLPEEKNILLSDELFQIRDLMLCKHANGLDWWLIVPKALDSKAKRIKILASGEFEHFSDIEFSANFWRARSTTCFAFSPNGDYLTRMIIRYDTAFQNLFELFSFDRCTGIPELILTDSLPLADRVTSSGDVEFSESGRFIYMAVGSIVLQLDLYEPDFFRNRDTIASWDGYLYASFLAPLFDDLWRLPNGKLLVASGVATPFLHYIHQPDLPGDSCNFEQRAIMLPPDPLNEPYETFITSLPNFPPYRMLPLAEPCITNTDQTGKEVSVDIYPNPAFESLTIMNAVGLNLSIWNLQGQKLFYQAIHNEERFEIDIGRFIPGLYFFVFSTDNEEIVFTHKLVKQ